MSVPSVCGLDRTWWEQITSYDLLKKVVGGRTVAFIVEETREGFVHACSPEQICAVLELLPSEDSEGIECFVLRQSTRKQWLLHPNWGRMAMQAEIGRAGRADVYTGPAIVIEAIDPSVQFRWRKSLGPEGAKELERLRLDGHKIVEDRRGYTFMSSEEAVRTTQLYRTIPHEIGHWVDWLEGVVRPARAAGSDYSALVNRYWSRPHVEREVFAHRYAEEFRRRHPMPLLESE